MITSNTFLSLLHYSGADLSIIILLSTLVIVLIIFIVYFNKIIKVALERVEKNSALQVTQNQALETSFAQSRNTILHAQTSMHANIEQRFGEVQQAMEKRLGEMSTHSTERLALSSKEMTRQMHHQLANFQEIKLAFEQRFGVMQNSIEQRLSKMSKQSIASFTQSNQQLHEVIQTRLNEISGQVEHRLNKGFEKTTETFTNVVKRLALIDAAQQKITELSSNVVSLQEVLTDKRSRGAFGEVQMSALIRNIMPEGSFSLQHTLSNNTRVDCLMFLPEPTGDIAIDSKFPLDSYKKMLDNELDKSLRKQAEKQFVLDIKKHINDISTKYIIAGETSDGAIMFIPAEAVFAEIHAHHPQLVEMAQRARVWLVSPTTLMAVLTTARAVLKDSATRKQVHLIQAHLVTLGKDFSRFKTRMDSLSKHIGQVSKDVDDVHTSAKKISNRFEKIEKVELKKEDIELIDQEKVS